MSRLFLIRHGESAWNAVRRLQGQADPPLSGRGEAQARALRPMLGVQDGIPAFCSDLERAVRTAALLGLEAVPDPRWREIHVGAWSGRDIDGLRAELPGFWRDWRGGGFTPPGGEAWGAFQARLCDAISCLPEDDVMVVTHGGVVRAIVSMLLGLPPDRLAPAPPASVTIVERGAWPRLRAYGAGAEIGCAAPD